MSTPEFRLRPATEADRTYLARLLYLTDVFGDESRPVSDNFAEDLGTYVDAWSPDQGGVIALSPQGVPAGGVWLRAGVDHRPVFGLVETALPELAIAVEGRFAGHGLGGALVDAALDLARTAGHPGVSLAVDDGNDRARRLYLRHGFQTVEHRGGLDCEVMVHRF
ncbi:GNAT family N-acetyltransferase [Corynebacterium halotolerans]|uniref:Putative acetyltransferase n=1 Tax=Corynebacterium halotolerans YIM 70093 = DSM 44683 TaxID=1121362 RepID=M1MVD5_9CORY|nr:GNAT family N-acetyltransferase [Corynebacterium halotolerans]AGF71684.1 putative acetyltransferase [Corynebacterium halotolerans YIM 70093 = DSM 44683]